MTIGVTPAPAEDGRHALFLANRPVIDAVIGIVSRQGRLSVDESEEFRSLVHLKLLEDDCAILRRFQGLSSLKTFLTTVITNMLRDDRVAKWGKWRPSAEAKRHGPLGILLERLVTRDGLTIDEACEVLETNHGVTEGRARLLAIYEALRPRMRRREVTDDELGDVPAVGTNADRMVYEGEHGEASARARAALSRTLAALPAQDRLIVKLKFKDGLTVADIGRMLRISEKSFYRRVEALMKGLGTALEREGVTRDEILDLIGEHGFDVSGVL
jgi:RNA polymerase sigma factor for flagellar operon FliA